MTHAHVRTTVTFLFASIVSLSAQQQPSSNALHAGDAPESITIRGCVAESMGRYMLDKALIVKPTVVPSAASDPSPAKTADDQVYELLGDQVKPHVGHQVEIVGTMPPNANGNARQPEDVKQTAHPMAGTVAVKRITMLASMCR